MNCAFALVRRLRSAVLLSEARGDLDRLERQVNAGEIGSLDEYLRLVRRAGRPRKDVAKTVLDMMDRLDAGGKREMMNHVFNPDFIWAARDMSDRRSVDTLDKIRRARRITLQKVGEALARKIEGAELKKHAVDKRVLLPGYYSYRSAATIELPPTVGGAIKVFVEDDEDDTPFLWLFVHTEGYYIKSVKTRMMNLGFPRPRTQRNPYELTMPGGPVDYALDVKAKLEGRTLAELREDALERAPLIDRLQGFLEFLKKAPPRRNPKGMGISWP